MLRFSLCFLTLACLVATFPAQEPTRLDLLVADFEGDDYGDWIVTGEAFGSGPARGTLAGQMAVSGFEGEGLVNTFFRGDDTTGTLTSPPFAIERTFLNFLIGGGMHPGEACLDLLVDGEVVRTATGPNDRPGGSEHLDWHTWDVAEFVGERAVLRVVDARTGGWGHVNLDHVVQSDRRFMADPAERTRTLVVDERYLHLPVKNGARMRRMKFVVDGLVVREFDIELADAEPDFLVFSDVEAFRGRELRIEVDAISAGSQGLLSIAPGADVPDAEGMYREPHRPQLHFSSRRGWNNDPNGLVFLEGEWHLYYQHNPYGWRWGNMHWAHAVSRDLVHWTELPVAIYPHRYGDWVFSGGAVVDYDDTGGFRTGDTAPIVASYTSTGRGECIAFSNDRGRTFTEYEGNPVLEHRGRDPKVVWYEPGAHWVMAVYDEFEGKRWIAFHTSKDLKHWELASRLEGYYECPELFELPVAGEEGESRWVVYAADGNYALGSFDGRTFTPSTEGKHRGNWGNCFYASQTFSDVPASDGRRIQIGWGRVATPGMPFNQLMLFPCSLTLRRTEEGLRMVAYPVREVELLRTRTHAWEAGPLRAGENPLAALRAELLDLELELRPGAATFLRLGLRGVPVTYDVAAGLLSCGDREAPLLLRDGVLRLRALVDRTTIELWGDDGLVYMPMGMILDVDDRTLSLSAVGGDAHLEVLRAHVLNSTWF